MPKRLQLGKRGKSRVFVRALTTLNDPTIPKGAHYKPSRPPNMRDEWEARPAYKPMRRMGYLDVEDEDPGIHMHRDHVASWYQKVA